MEKQPKREVGTLVILTAYHESPWGETSYLKLLCLKSVVSKPLILLTDTFYWFSQGDIWVSFEAWVLYLFFYFFEFTCLPCTPLFRHRCVMEKASINRLPWSLPMDASVPHLSICVERARSQSTLICLLDVFKEDSILYDSLTFWIRFYRSSIVICIYMLVLLFGHFLSHRSSMTTCPNKKLKTSPYGTYINIQISFLWATFVSCDFVSHKSLDHSIQYV